MNRDNIARLSISGPSVASFGHLSMPLNSIHTKKVHEASKIETAGNGIKKYCNSNPSKNPGTTQYAINMIAAGTMPIANILFPRTSIPNMNNQGEDVIITTTLIPNSSRSYLSLIAKRSASPSSPSEKHGWRVFGGMMGPVQ